MFAISLANVRLYEVFAVVHRITVPRVNKQHFINWCHHFSSKSSSVEFGKKDEDLTSRNTGPDKTFIQDIIFKTGENSDYSDYSSKLYKSHSLLLIFSSFILYFWYIPFQNVSFLSNCYSIFHFQEFFRDKLHKN